jgi:hypothetical protein
VDEEGVNTCDWHRELVVGRRGYAWRLPHLLFWCCILSYRGSDPMALACHSRRHHLLPSSIPTLPCQIINPSSTPAPAPPPTPSFHCVNFNSRKPCHHVAANVPLRRKLQRQLLTVHHHHPGRCGRVAQFRKIWQRPQSHVAHHQLRREALNPCA